MPLDAYKNFAAATLAAGINSSATSLSVASGQGARFAAPPFNATIYNATDYSDPTDAYHAGQAVIARVTNIAGDVFTIAQGQEGTTPVNLNTGGKTYRIVAGLTAKFSGDLPSGSGLTNPMTSPGDLIVGGASGAPQRLAAPTGNDLYRPLMVVSGGVGYSQIHSVSGVGRATDDAGGSVSLDDWEGYDKLSTGSNSTSKPTVGLARSNNKGFFGGRDALYNPKFISISSRFRIPTPSDGSQTFTCWVSGFGGCREYGFGDLRLEGPHYGILIDTDGNAKAWKRIGGGVTTAGSVPITANTWYKADLRYVWGQTAMDMYINDTLLASLPCAASPLTQAGSGDAVSGVVLARIEKSAGTTARELHSTAGFANIVF